MIHPLTMPKWGLSMKTGRVVGWLVNDGAEIVPGAELAEIETEKILGSLEASATGVLRRKVAAVDDQVPVGGLLAVIAESSISEAQIDQFIAEFQTRFVPEPDEAESTAPGCEVADVSGHSLRYLKRGEGAEAALLIHGFGGDLNNWLFNHEALAGSRAVYALDLPGHGGSSKRVGDGSLQEFSQILGSFMETVGLSKAHLVGHSMGGAVALNLALAHPQKVVSLALIASAAFGPEIDGEYIEGFITAGRRKELKPHLDKLFCDSKLVGRQMVEDVLKYKRTDGVELALRTLAAQFFPGGRQAVVLRERLGQLSVPTLVVWGAEDRILPSLHGKGLPENIKTEILSECGHMVQMEAATQFNRLIQSFWQAR